jgi:hypothetical protein
MEELVENLSDENNTIMIDLSPKFHCEIAGKGIKYSWGLSQRDYRNKPLAHKKGAANFRKRVIESLDHVKIHHVRKFQEK